jgi:hypothetical protein
MKAHADADMRWRAFAAQEYTRFLFCAPLENLCIRRFRHCDKDHGDDDDHSKRDHKNQAATPATQSRHGREC